MIIRREQGKYAERIRCRSDAPKHAEQTSPPPLAFPLAHPRIPVGFSTVAFNHVVATRYSGQVNPFATAAAALGERSRPVFPELAPRSDGSAKGKERAAGIVQLQRVTITLDDETMKGKGIGLVSLAFLILLKCHRLARATGSGPLLHAPVAPLGLADVRRCNC